MAEPRVEKAPIGDDQVPMAKERVTQIFKYLQELHRVRTPPYVQLSQREWVLPLDQLPLTPHVKRGFQLDDKGRIPATAEGGHGEFVLKVGRPAEIECPEPSVVLKNWLRPSYQDARIESKGVIKNALKVRGGARQTFDDSAERVDAFEEWAKERAEWAKEALDIALAFDVFSDLFDLYARFERESEKYQLFLADGVLEMDTEHGRVRHPLLLQRVELRFDPAVPEFSIVDTVDTPEVYTPLLRHIGLDGRAIQHVTDAVAKGHFHPLAGESTNAFFRDIAQGCWTDGQFFEDADTAEASGGPRITRRPHLILGNRSYGLAENIERYLEVLEGTVDLPESLLRIVGVSSGRERPSGPTGALLTKPANPEQVDVIRRLEQTGAVLVQGPPGTGKSHTIANLIGHLLAQKKSILVTSHASKALRVVREKLSPALQPLCVSVLQSDDESAKQLEESINGIVNTLAATSEERVTKEIAKLEDQRRQLLDQQQSLRQQLITAVQDEYSEIEVLGERLLPVDILRRLEEWRGTHDWIPGDVAADAGLPLDQDQFEELYQLTSELSVETEAMARADLPDPEAFESPKDFAAALDELAALEKDQDDIDKGSEYWKHDEQDPAQLAEILERLQQSVALLDDEDGWVQDCIEAGRRGGKSRAGWLHLADLIEACAGQIPDREPKLLQYSPAVDSKRPVRDLLKTAREIRKHLVAGKTLARFIMWRHRDWRELLGCATVDGQAPTSVEHLQAIVCALEVRELREGLVQHWERIMVPLGAPGARTLGQRPEVKALRYSKRIRAALSWYPEVWAGCEGVLDKLGLDWKRLSQKSGAGSKGVAEPAAIRALVEQHLEPAFTARDRQLRLIRLRAQREHWLTTLASVPQKGPHKGLLQRFRTGIRKADYDSYADAWHELAKLHAAQATLLRRDELLAQLEQAAPGWAAALRERAAGHVDGRLPGDLELAWQFAQWSVHVDRQAKADLDQLQEQLDATDEQLFLATAGFVEKSSWLAQLERTGLEEQQALAGWLQLQKKIGKGSGKHVSLLKEEAKQALVRCRNAVPVWIMPMSRVVESFDLATTRFDVVILDEASQCDVMGLLAFALGREVVVVGDHEQVSPYAVGMSTDQVRALIEELLPDVPNHHLYDGKTSVYDLAQQSFGGTIRLLEHFRCVPDIIRFSNELCYNGEIRPLREAGSTDVTPALVSRRVPNGVEKNGINECEAQEIAALVAALCRLEEYADCSVGVISMVGTDQALYIDSILRSRLSATEYRRRKVLCGNASQFQGDERDVIFLSMVNSPGEHALPLRRRDDQRKVFNVAASRARDQLWVVHSLEPGRDLKGGDLRLRLISHVESAADDGEAAKTSKAKAKAKAPAQQRHFASELERELCHRLEDRGYLVLRHYPIGDGVIDLVVEGLGGRRVAVQCDGDRVLAGDIVEDQLAQQMSLRRLGWEFLRVRASDVVRDGEQAFARLFQRLGERGVRPGAAAAQDAGSSGISEPLHEKVIHRAEQIRRRWHVPSPAELLRLPNHADGDAQSGEGSGPESAGEVPERAEDGPAPQSTEPALDSDDGSDLD